MMRSAPVLAALLMTGCAPLPPLAAGEPAEEAMRYRWLSDGQMEDFAPRQDGTLVEFRNLAHDVVISASYSRRTVDPAHRGPVFDTLTIAIEHEPETTSWTLSDRNRSIVRYRIGLAPTGQGAGLAIIVQRQSTDGLTYTSVRVVGEGQGDPGVELPPYKGGMWDRVGRDIDSDGTLEFEVPDMRFANVAGNAPPGFLPPLVFASQHGSYVDASRDGSYIYLYRDLLSVSAQDCLERDEDETDAAHAATCWSYLATKARAGSWESARHRIAELGLGLTEDAVIQRLTEWGYLPQDPAARWWTASWKDFYGEEQDGGVPFEIRQLIYDWQGCDHFSNEPTERADGSINEYVVDQSEQHCLWRDATGELVSLDEVRGDWLHGKYADDPAAHKLLEQIESFVFAD